MFWSHMFTMKKIALQKLHHINCSCIPWQYISIYFYIYIYIPMVINWCWIHKPYLVGGWPSTPLKNHGVSSSVGARLFHSQYDGKVIQNSMVPVTTNQIPYMGVITNNRMVIDGWMDSKNPWKMVNSMVPVTTNQIPWLSPQTASENLLMDDHLTISD